MDVTLRQPKGAKKKAKANERQLRLPYMDLVPGWTGWRWLLCSDSKWHLVSAILAGNAADTQCCEGVTVAQQSNPNNHPMCNDCCEIQAARWGKGPRAER